MTKKILLTVVAFVLVLSVVGCATSAQAPRPANGEGWNYSYDADDMSMPAAEPMMEREVVVEKMAAEVDESYAPSDSASGINGHANAVEQLIIYNAYLELVVSDAEVALEQIKDLVREGEGYIVESSVYQYQQGARASVRLRVPTESLDATLDHIRDLANEVRSESLDSQDVTADYVDLQSRLRNLQKTEDQLLKFLEEAEDTEAALSVYEHLQIIQNDIEVTKGRMKFYEESAAMATVSLELIPDELAQPIEVGGWHPEGTLRDAFEMLVRAFQFLADALIVIVVFVIPVAIGVALPFVGLFFLIRAMVRRRRARKQQI